MNEPQKHYAKWNESETNNIASFIYIKYLYMQIHRYIKYIRLPGAGGKSEQRVTA